MPNKKALYLTGGGARGAYQAGVLKGICDILGCKHVPVGILSSVSVGSINASYLAMHADNFYQATERLYELWSTLTCDHIFQTSNLALLKSVLRNVIGVLFHRKSKGGDYLLDTTPLKELLYHHLDFKTITQHLDSGLLDSFEVATTCYEMSSTVSFFQSGKFYEEWKKIRDTGCSTHLHQRHIMASSSLPLFFPTVKINNLHYGDGGMRQANPLRGMTKFGADSILIIGTRQVPKLSYMPREKKTTKEVTFSMIFGAMFNALFLDNVERDLDVLERINQHIDLLHENDRETSKWRKIKVLYLRPQHDLGALAVDKINALPFLLRYLMSAFGRGKQSGDFLSFLLFDKNYCKLLLELGHQEALQQRTEIEEFFSS